ncbi:amino acid adenylation domain-containing protein [Brevibacillus antibioticus]|uniref:Amino acid adenylation domain-containing protein n=1 Tax=Brevibacillus antibioticus TaxID=2570228 RepID=A0A4U2Y3S3_9BACL|nr:non-ribosomal peptide synthetase [Brevibacillus antibioticus]TKI55059.1 amino acid adenylation domain-containing protein [Brevibacillus antibioticus]
MFIPVYYPLSHPQKRIWFIEKFYPHTSMYNIGGLVHIHGKVNFSVLEEAIQLFIKKNEGLRLQITEQEGEPSQYVMPYVKHKLPYLDFSRKTDPMKAADEWAEIEFQTGFQINNTPLFDFALLHISEDHNAYFVKLHHIVSDGWTILIMTNQISTFYMQLLRGEQVDGSITSTYLHYLEQEQNYLTSSRYEKDKAYWNERLSNFPRAFLSRSSDSVAGKRLRFYLEADTAHSVYEFLQTRKCSLNSLFVAIVFIYLAKTTREDDIIIGVPVLNRSGVKEKNIVGMFTSNMPFRGTINQTISVAEWINEVQADMYQSLFHQKYPYDLFVQDLQLTQQGYDHLFQWCVNYYNTKLNNELDGAPIENEEFYSGNQNYSLQLVIKEWSGTDKLELQWDYKTSDYTEKEINRMFRQMVNLLKQAIAQPDKPIKSLQLLSEEERQELIYNRNQTVAPYPHEPVHFLFEHQAAATPEATSVIFQGQTVSYEKLNNRSNQLAHTLRNKGVGRGSLVGLMSSHSIETIVGILAVLKAGGAYVPIDPTYPLERINYLLNDSGTALILTNMCIPEGVTFKGDVVNLVDDSLYSSNCTNLDHVNELSDPVYVIYTSGSTGNPKGTIIEHHGLINYISWASKTYIRSADDVFGLYSSLAFDLTVTSIFTPLINGNGIAIYPEDKQEFILHRILREKVATIIKLTPAHLSLIKNQDNRGSTIHTLIVGGEDLKAALAHDVTKSFGGHVKIFNEYGPTETVVGCMFHRYDPALDMGPSVSIGKPIANVQIYLLDANLQPVPDGGTGEIYISGDGVAKGYLNRPELTSERFILNPFRQGSRMYKTGDLAIRQEHGSMFYLGRSDTQVKIKGYRIETGEIENRLLQYPGVRDAVVIDCIDTQGNKYLISYLVMEQVVSAVTLKNYLAESMPSYMIPAYFVLIDEIPLTPNGKVNRNNLPDPTTIEAVSLDQPVTNQVIADKLLIIMRDVLQIEELSIRDNFFLLGGDSIKAIRIVAKLRAEGLHVQVKDILSYPVLAEIAATIDAKQPNIAEQAPAEGVSKPLPISEWFFQQDFVDPHHWNQSVLLTMKQAVSPDALTRAFRQLIVQHDTLRLVFDPAQQALAYDASLLKAEVPIETQDLSGFDTEAQKRERQQHAEATKASLHLEKGFLFRIMLFNLGQGTQQLLITAHHLIIDAVSWRILLEDLTTLLEAMKQGHIGKLPAKSHSVQAWADALADYSQTQHMLAAEQAYWQSVLTGPSIAFPTDHNHDIHELAQCETISAELSQDLTRQLTGEANKAYNTHANDLLITALAAAIDHFIQKGEVMIELEGHGREPLFDHIDLSRTIGWFTCMYPVRLQVSTTDPSTLIKSIKEQLRQIPQKGIGYGILKYLSKTITYDTHSLVRFNYLGDSNISNEWFTLSDKSHGAESSLSNHITSLIDINAVITDSVLTIRLVYSRNNFTSSTMERFLAIFLQKIEEIVNYCCGKENTEFTPCDFNTVELSQDELDGLFE